MWPKDNIESWKRLRGSIDEYPNDAYWLRYKQMVSSMLDALEARGLAPVLRAGQSMHYVMFSTLDHHCLKNEPRVTLRISVKEEEVRIFYSYVDVEFKEPASEVTVPFAEAVAITLEYLRRLWRETKLDAEIPLGLRTG